VWSCAAVVNPVPCLDFYLGIGTDGRGRYLKEILHWPDAQLEEVRDYIQWTFPLAERSGWITLGNHNHLRITRILKSLLTLGLQEEAVAFYDCLEDIYRAGKRQLKSRHLRSDSLVLATSRE
jgi:hypothetical protein